MKTKVLTFAFLLLTVQILYAQYIDEVLEYKPAPGQFINDDPWGVPSAAESIEGTVTGTMTLGAFGGYVIFKFENPVENHPDNPFGVDFTIFGNPSNTWSEPGIVSVMNDENGNGLPDDTWYELAGSDYFFSTTIHNYEITYTNPNQDAAADVPWEDNQGNTGVVFANTFHTQPYYPLNNLFPDVNSTSYTLSGTMVANELDKSIPTFIKSYRKTFGYADNQLRGSEPYTVPDNPYTWDKENSGGDAFDISWAVDENGNYVDLDEIHFIRVHNAVLGDGGWLGELSTEITGAVDVAPDASISGETDLLLMLLPDTIYGNSHAIEVFPFNVGRWNPDALINWDISLDGVAIDTENLMTFSTSGNLVLTASLADNPSITVTDSTILVFEEGTQVLAKAAETNIKVFPNPASDYITIEGVREASVSIFSLTGKTLYKQDAYTEQMRISLENFPKGVYILQLKNDKTNQTIRLIKE